MDTKKVVVVAGPTATGKTQTSLDFAQYLENNNIEIVNFDSLLFYKELNIGTAKPTPEEMSHVPHHLVSTHSINAPINAADFVALAHPIIEEIHQRNKIVILVGGSGFYLQALLNGMYESKTTSPELRLRSDKLFSEKGINPFREILKNNDVKSFERYHENDHYRIRRAVEHFWMTGKPFSKAREGMEVIEEFAMAKKLGWDLQFFYLDVAKERHQKIIESRSENMIKMGLVDEVEKLLEKGFTGEEKPLKSIGYKETIDYINGVFASEDEYIERLTINTRQLAKAQRTWFKKLSLDTYNPLTDREKMLKVFSNFVSNEK